MYDVIIVGGGPAGMTAALYAQRNGKSALVIEKNGFGGQITHSPRVENFPGTLSISGTELADQMMEQILAQGAEIEWAEVTDIKVTAAVSDSSNIKQVFTEDGQVYEGRTVVLATGVKHRMLGLPDEESFVGEGISFCAVCDGDFYAGKSVCVAGGGNSALQEALLLADKCSSVTILQDLDFCTGEQRLQDLLFARPNVSLHTGVKITGLLQNAGAFAGVTISKAGGDPQDIPCDGLFVAVGLIPENDAFASVADLNAYGYFDSDERCLTRTPGIFTAGDCRSKSIRQVVTAMADGAVAALAACRYIDGMA